MKIYLYDDDDEVDEPERLRSTLVCSLLPSYFFSNDSVDRNIQRIQRIKEKRNRNNKNE